MTNAANDPSRQDWSAGEDSSNAKGIQIYSIVGGKEFYVLCDLVTSAGDLHLCVEAHVSVYYIFAALLLL